MHYIFDYILKFSVSLAVVYLFYQLLLRKLTFYNWNRWYLLGYTALSFLIPFINISATLEKTENQFLQYIPVIEVSDQPRYEATVSQSWTIWNWAMILLLIGIAILIMKFIVRYLSFLQVRRGATLLSNGETKLFLVNKDIIPFSFGNSIFINQRLHSETELENIIRHEFVHVKQRHTYDIIWSELLCVLNWYNPFAWMIRKAIRQNLEFIADSKVLENGIDKRTYQYLLLKVTGNTHFSIANQFNFSSLKKRIVMMNKMKSARAQLIKFLFIVPLVAVLLVAFRNERSSEKNQQSPDDSILRAAFTDSVPDAPINEKGYYIDIKGVGSNCVVVVKDKNKKEVERLLLTKWNEREDYYEGLYGNIPPPPPPPPPAHPMPPHAPSLPENVKSFTFTGDEAIITLKDGTIEKFDLKDKKEAERFHNKYGKLMHHPVPPPPPPHPHHVNIEGVEAPVAITHGSGWNTSPVITNVHTGTTVAAPIATTVTPGIASTIHSGMGVTVATEHPITAVGVTGYTPPIHEGLNVAVTHPALVTGVIIHSENAETVLEMKIFKSTSREKIDKLIAEAKSKGAELSFAKLEYNNKNELMKIVGKMSKDDSKSDFSVTDFEVVTLRLVKIDGRYSCRVLITSEKEEM